MARKDRVPNPPRRVQAPQRRSTPSSADESRRRTLLLVVVSNLVGALGYLAHGWAGDRFGRRNTIAVGWLLSGGFFAAMLLGRHVDRGAGGGAVSAEAGGRVS